MTAAVAEVPQVAELAKILAAQMVKADINEDEGQYIVRAGLMLAALQKAKGRPRPAARYLGVPLGKFEKWLAELHLEQTQKEMRRACESQLQLSLRRPRKPNLSAAAQSIPSTDTQPPITAKA